MLVLKRMKRRTEYQLPHFLERLRISPPSPLKKYAVICLPLPIIF
jgi:hypothetical protein